MNNIAEDSESGTDGLFIRYLYTTKGSCGEVRSMLYLCEDLNYCSNKDATTLKKSVINISLALQKLIDKLKKKRQMAV
ncbi:four helix bundle protein [Microbacter margulisiae]|uniref:Four helix bundle protein n=1 Tax=Microbacter margulisiae TaxID=1350067 RepID=A0A7W5H0V3_9PORP|nr:four helix bundle protein [Microbacter margulisiae]MBB3185959.1 four helix bundle protein [Microbacter margulisiae]